MHGVYCGRTTLGGGALLSVVPSQMSTVCGGLDLQRTGRRSPLQSAANQPVSNTRCYRGHNVQSAVPPVTPRGFSFRLLQRPLSWTLSSVNMPSKASGFTCVRTLSKPSCILGAKGFVVPGGGGEKR